MFISQHVLPTTVGKASLGFVGDRGLLLSATAEAYQEDVLHFPGCDWLHLHAK